MAFGRRRILLKVGKSYWSRSTVRITALGDPYGGFNRARQTPIGCDVFSTHYHIQPCLSACHGRIEVDDRPREYRSRRAGCPLGFVDCRRRR
jgi:hypothetical protein